MIGKIAVLLIAVALVGPSQAQAQPPRGGQQGHGRSYSSHIVTPGGQVIWSPYTYLPGGGAIYDPYDAYGHQFFIPGQNPIWTPPVYNPWQDPVYQPYRY